LDPTFAQVYPHKSFIPTVRTRNFKINGPSMAIVGHHLPTGIDLQGMKNRSPTVHSPTSVLTLHMPPTVSVPVFPTLIEDPASYFDTDLPWIDFAFDPGPIFLPAISHEFRSVTAFLTQRYPLYTRSNHLSLGNIDVPSDHETIDGSMDGFVSDGIKFLNTIVASFGIIINWELQSGTTIHTLKSIAPYTSFDLLALIALGWSPDGEMLVVSGLHTDVVRYARDTTQIIFTLRGDPTQTMCFLVWSFNENFLAIFELNNQVLIWDVWNFLDQSREPNRLACIVVKVL
jgi:hypothetical protein